MQQHEPEKMIDSANAESMDLAEEPFARLRLSSPEKEDQAHPEVNENMDIDISRPLVSPSQTRLPIQSNSTTKKTKCSLGIIPVLSPSKKTQPPFMGPIGWTVPPKRSYKRSEPFLIYQDPDFYDPARAYNSNHACFNTFASDDDKENEPVMSDPMSPSLSSMEDEDVIMAQDNILIDAADIVTLADTFHSDGARRPQSQDGYIMQIDEDKSVSGTQSTIASIRRRQRTDPVMAISAHSHLF